MDWDEINDILFEGSKKQIEEVLCPDCRGFIEFHYSSVNNEMNLKCTGECGHLEKMHGLSGVPNCAIFLGSDYVIKPKQ